MDSNRKGAIAEAAIIHAATELGLVVLKPLSDGRRYDLVLDNGSRLLRTQCKWATLDGGVVVVRIRTSRVTPAGYVATTYAAGEIDGIAAYCRALGDAFWLPIEEFEGQGYAHLRVAPARNNQRQLVKWAADYRFGAVAQLGERRAGSAKVRGSSPLSSTVQGSLS